MRRIRGRIGLVLAVPLAVVALVFGLMIPPPAQACMATASPPVEQVVQMFFYRGVLSLPTDGVAFVAPSLSIVTDEFYPAGIQKNPGAVTRDMGLRAARASKKLVAINDTPILLMSAKSEYQPDINAICDTAVNIYVVASATADNCAINSSAGLVLRI